MRAIMTIGEVNGMIENQNANCELGSRMTTNIISRARIIGSVMGICNWDASCTLSTAEPTAANIAA